MSTKGETAGFTARDLTLLAGAMQCTKGEVQIDYKKFAEQCGFKNTDSARASWNGLRKKLDKAGGAAVAASPGGAEEGNADACKGPKRKKEDAAGEDDAVESGQPKTPKKGRKAPAKGKKAANSPKIGDDEDDEGAVKEEEAQ